MQYLRDELDFEQPLSALRRSYGCRCNRAVFFRNTHCLNCDTPLGYEPQLGKIFSLEPGPHQGSWRLAGPDVVEQALYYRCANLESAAACNWLVKEENGVPRQPYCISCRLNRMVPDLSVHENSMLWRRLENAKRRVVSALLGLGLPVVSRVSEDPQRGLAFDFLRSPANGPRVLTGHDNGLITINIEEADDAKRELMRSSMHEPYRTLVGHFRHEVGHYYWDRLVANSPWLHKYRELFGDERADYNGALQRNYKQGPALGWPEWYVSAYASVHPWEDWAETWAHYLHMVDTLGTAMSFGVKPETMSMPFECFGPDALCEHGQADSQFLSFVNSWLKLAAVMNELCRSMGQPDFYPFALPRAVVAKLHFVHLVVSEAGDAAAGVERRSRAVPG
jgi:hypothetical protein